MRKTTATLLAVLAAFILIFCIAFTAVSLTASNIPYFEKEFKALGIGDALGIPVSDLSHAYQAVFGYMSGSRDSIDVDVMMNGTRVPMYDLEIEHTHMKEVRTLWQRLTGFRGIFLLGAALLALAAISFDRHAYKVNICNGYLWGFGVFLLVFAFGATWSGLNFSSFWTFFHRVIFPGSDTWLLPETSRLVRMLPEALFNDVVRRCALLTLLPTFALAGGAITWLILLARKERKALGADNIITVEAEEEDEMLAVGEPDLIFVHKMANLPVSRRKQLVREMEERDAMEAQADRLRAKEEESLGEDPTSFSSSDDALRVKFEPFNPEEESTDEE